MYREVDGVCGWFVRLCFDYHNPNTEGAALSRIGLGAINEKLTDKICIHI